MCNLRIFAVCSTKVIMSLCAVLQKVHVKGFFPWWTIQRKFLKKTLLAFLHSFLNIRKMFLYQESCFEFLWTNWLQKVSARSWIHTQLQTYKCFLWSYLAVGKDVLRATSQIQRSVCLYISGRRQKYWNRGSFASKYQ